MSYEQARAARAEYLNALQAHDRRLNVAIDPILRYLRDKAGQDFSLVTKPYFQVPGGPILLQMSLLGLSVNFSASPIQEQMFKVSVDGREVATLDQREQGSGQAAAEAIFAYAASQYREKLAVL